MISVPDPIQLFVELTSACNLKCTHCYVNAGIGKLRQLGPSLLHSAIQEFRELGGCFITLSGGEPTLFRDWRATVRFSKHVGLEVTLLTNGTRLTVDDVKFLKDEGIHLAISVDGGSALTHDHIRGVGAFDETVAALRTICQFGLGPMLTLCFTPMASNYTELPRIVALAHELGAGKVYLSLLEDRGRASSNIESLKLDKQERIGVIFTVSSLQERYPNVEIECTNLRFFTERLRGQQIDCDDLDRTIRMTADGDLFLTAYLDAEPFALGRYREGCLGEIWRSLKVQHAFAAAASRRTLTPQCQSCEAWEWCRGGSATFAWAKNGTFYSVDGYCDAKRTIVADLMGAQLSLP